MTIQKEKGITSKDDKEAAIVEMTQFNIENIRCFRINKSLLKFLSNHSKINYKLVHQPKLLKNRLNEEVKTR